MTSLNPNQIVIPAQNSANNSYIQDIVGNKTDTVEGNSVYSYLYIIEEHIHSISYVYPSLANDPLVTAGDSGAWAEGTKVEIVPASTITSPFDLHFFALSAISAAGIFQINFYKGGAGSEILIAQKKFAKGTNNEPLISQPLQTELIPANTRISASLACLAGTAKTVNVSICYHIY